MRTWTGRVQPVERYWICANPGRKARGSVPAWLFFGSNAVLALALLVAPSFAMIRRIYDFNTICLPALLLIAAGVRLRQRRAGSPGSAGLRLSSACIAAAVLLVGLRVYATHVEPHRLKVRRVVVETEKISVPLRILHISDIQSARVGAYEEAAFAKMRELKPDLVLFTGDLLQVNPPSNTAAELRKMAVLFDSLSPRFGKYRVLGDVDWETNRASTAELGGVITLEDTGAGFPVEGGQVQILGLRRSGSRKGNIGLGTISAWLRTTRAEDFTIVLGHAPDYAMAVAELPIDLCLAGHTHGGQVRIPFMGPIVTLSGVPRAWARGFRPVGNTRLNVSAGIGCEHTDAVPPIRFACPPEMTLIEVVPCAKKQQPAKGGEQ